MIVININNARSSILKEVAKKLRQGAIVVYPTDTAYALGCDATNAKAVAKIFKIKGRDAAKALPIIVADTKMAKKFFSLSFPRRRESNHRLVVRPPNMDWTPASAGVTKIISLAKKYWPGPLSIILKAKRGIAKAALNKGTAAVRVPDSWVARTIAKYLGRPLVATSANISYQPTCYSVRAYLNQIGRNRARRATSYVPDIVLDAGGLRRRRPSTIVKIGKNGRIEVLRNGPVNILRAKSRACRVTKSRRVLDSADASLEQ